MSVLGTAFRKMDWMDSHCGTRVRGIRRILFPLELLVCSFFVVREYYFFPSARCTYDVSV
jgi:hypothetical protein